MNDESNELDVQDISRRRLSKPNKITLKPHQRSNLVIERCSAALLDDFSQSLSEQYTGTAIGNFQFSGPCDVSSLIARSSSVNASIHFREDSGKAMYLCKGIEDAYDLKTLVLDVPFSTTIHGLDEEHQLFDCVTAAIMDGKLLDLTCRLSLVHNRTDSLECWANLHRLHITKNGHNESLVILPSDMIDLGQELIGLLGKSKSLRELRIDFEVDEEDASILRRMVLRNFCGLSEVYEYATIDTVVRVASRVWEAPVSLCDGVSTNDDSEVDYDALAFSVAYDVIRESAGIIANWCKTSHSSRRHQIRRDDEEKTAETIMDVSDVDNSSPDAKRRRRSSLT